MDERTIEFHKDEEEAAVTNQNGLVCVITSTRILYIFFVFFPVHWAMARVQYAAGRNYQTQEAPRYQCFYWTLP
jgi:hypothetical protein